MTKSNAILCRTNAGCVEVAIAQHAQGLKVALIISGGLGGLRKFAEGAKALMAGQRAEEGELAAFKDWSEVQSYAKSDEGLDLRPMVKLMDTYGPDAIFQICRTSLDMDKRHDADVQICTAHKSKGLEWDRVVIHNDFNPPKDGEGVRPDDLRLMYVAVTRARLYLDASAIEWAINGRA